MRKPRVLLAILAAATIALTGCGSSGSTGDADSGSGDSSWSYTDDLGNTVTLDHTPTKVAGLTDPLVSLMNYGIKPVAAFGWSTVDKDPRFEKFDVSGITTLGATYGEIDEEKLIEAAPDVIVTTVYPTDEKGTIDDSQPLYGFNDKEQQEKIAKIAPVIAIKMGGKGADVIASQARLALALGASQDTVDAAKATYDQAATTLKDAAAATDVTVTVLYGDADGAYVVKPADEPITELYQELGVTFFEPTPEGYYWGIYSWENAGKIGGDLMLLQKDGYSKEEMAKQATLAQTPAFKAGQIESFTSPGLDYVSQADYMTTLAGYLADAKVVTD
ncbi:ABC transporter substrate-binding protein [Kineosporia sp. J2-2]|uniref:ABC transporter substrate-binding protein n=1 Tax=Kineosporia corallincola TaxID=2835133 RepID=A0ABS5TBA2_9ACTN|nr:ABC transporter substrate-binding protein [Kineosporia corallincola]MBT0768334.1 ABC transporter substrate-binding protein [Kineosporia corallincola]